MSKFDLAPCDNRMHLPVWLRSVNQTFTRSWFCLLFSLLFSLYGYAQPMVADFSANTTSGCSPLAIAFKDLTTGSPKFWNWDFGNGTLSNAQNPVVTYSQPGTYTVKLVVRNADGTTGITKTDFITIYPSPQASFVTNFTTGCVPVTVQFTDRSTSTAGNIVSWQWNFGDGATSTEQSPSHTYTNTGFYNVSLTVTSSTGCRSVYSVNRLIRIVSGVKAEFDNSKPESCQAPYNNITFKNLSSGPGNMTFQWDLGNGSNSTDPNPTTSYATAATYNVTLTATSEFGCSGTITKPVTFGGPTTAIKGPDTVCQNATALFVNDGSAAPQKSVWDFGNGIQKTGKDESFTYTALGDFTVKLTNTYAGCIDSAIKKVHVRSTPVVDFKVLNGVACKPPLNVTFEDASPTPIVKWVWDFGDGGSGTGSPVNHMYNAAGDFTVKGTFTDANGCEVAISKQAVIKIEAPTVKINNVPAGGCVPYTYTPVATVTALDGIATYSWDFGDGTVITGTNPSPSHTYTSTGAYDIKLTITTTGGCTVTATERDGVKVGTPPATNFSMSATDVCASEIVSFTDLTPQPVDDWFWQFGDGGTSTQKNPTHLFTDSGTFVVKLTAFNNRCPFQGAGQQIHIKPPIARFSPRPNCNNLDVNFINLSKTDPSYGAISYSWNFGDGTTSTDPNPTHTFPAYGTYPVTLTVTNGSCTHTFAETVKLIKEQAAFTNVSPICRGGDFSIISSNSAQLISQYEWSIDGAPYVAGPAHYRANIGVLGWHSIGLVITDINGCTDTLVKSNAVNVTAPVTNFTAASAGGCKDVTITFNDNSSSPLSTLVKWTFDFGDGKRESFTNAPFTHPYTDTGLFVPKLIVEDAMGCTDSVELADTLFIATLVTDFTSDYDTICPSSSVQFTDASVGAGLTYFWDFGNGSTSTQQNPSLSYGGNNAAYTVKLVITDRGGCKDSITRSNYITTLKPIPAFDIRDTLTICPPIESKFFFKGEHYESFEWNFGDGSTSTLQDPTHFYNAYGDFTAWLILTGYGGCKDSVSANVHVYDPGTATQFNYSPLDACNELLVDFTLKPIPDMKFAVHFGDGTLDSSMATTYQHFYKSPAFYSPSVQYLDNQGCIAGVSGPPIRVIGAEPFFGVDRKKFCDSGIVYFTNYTIGNDPVVSRTWNFGDGSPTTSDQDPAHFFRRPGTFIVSQNVTTQQGCSKTITDTIRVYRTPDPYIVGDSIGCINATLNLRGMLRVPDTAITWKWTPGNQSTKDISVSFPNSGDYTMFLQATNSFGCTDSARKELFVPPLPSVTVNDNPVIPVTTGVILPVTYGHEVENFTWSPAKNLSCTRCPTPYANPKFTTTYNVKVEDHYGCTNSADVTVTVVCNGLNYFVPNTFSPNGDGVNDIFAPRGVGLTRVNSMRIFNRWGEMVYERMNFMANDRTPTGGWDGTYKGKPASADVYVYIIEFVCENAAIVPVKGNVALVR
ncbi:PKD domain-containing protein [Longitalea arenae]|uniref:PKD domain-containing protein n=1 Tax=Longitalea arenae TaxID=2812558 RepID=UPI0019674758|nr:PKD domain-containing protein [Longitalea arenae]